MITRRSVFKTPLCHSCTRLIHVKFQDNMELVKCGYDEGIPLTPTNLAIECRQYTDVLKEQYWELLEKQTREIPIIGEKKAITAGFKVQKEEG